jgi:hypothetical protein
VDWLTKAAEDAVQWIEALVRELDTVDWVLLALAAVALYWIWAAVRASTRLGPVEVELLEHDGAEGSKPAVHELTSTLRERLANSGLVPPPAVPAGSPQTDLLAAVEASAIPQAAFVAKVMQLVRPPQPPTFKLSGTLRGSPIKVEPPHAPYAFPPEQTNGIAQGVSFWLRPSSTGRELLETVPGADHEEAVCRAAARVFVHISREAVNVFPTWARWTTAGSFESFVEGTYALRELREQDARQAFEKAAAAEPRNLLPLLQLINLDERRAARRIAETNAGDAAYTARVSEQARVLRRYLDLAVERPTLVTARYRASVLASTLATRCTSPDLASKVRAGAGVSVPAGASREQVAKALHELAARESEAVVQLLHVWYVPLRKLRLRHRYEMTGYDRRVLKRAVIISRHALAIRRRLTSRSAVRFWWRRAAVWLWHLQLCRATVGWQAEYNAACFYGLLDLRELKSGGARGGPLGWLEHPRDRAARVDKRRRAFRKAAYRRLNRAIAEEHGGELSGEWLEKADPDLETLRDDKVLEWRLVKARYRGEDRSDLGYPERPWGSPIRRRRAWGTAALISLLAGVIVAAEAAVLYAILFAVACVFAARRSVLAGREAAVQRPGESPTND